MLEGLPWEEIVGKSSDFDLVVLGRKSGKSRVRLFSKSTIQRVIDSAACPVLVVNDGD